MSHISFYPLSFCCQWLPNSSYVPRPKGIIASLARWDRKSKDVAHLLRTDEKFVILNFDLLTLYNCNQAIPGSDFGLTGWLDWCEERFRIKLQYVETLDIVHLKDIPSYWILLHSQPYEIITGPTCHRGTHFNWWYESHYKCKISSILTLISQAKYQNLETLIRWHMMDSYLAYSGLMKNGVCQCKFAYWVTAFCIRWPNKEHGLNYITFYVQKRITHLAMYYNQPLVRDKPLGASARICETRGRRY